MKQQHLPKVKDIKMRILLIIMLGLLLQSCGELMPSERLASCNGINNDCKWHDIHTHQVISLPKHRATIGTMTRDAGNANIGNGSPYPW